MQTLALTGRLTMLGEHLFDWYAIKAGPASEVFSAI